VKVAGTRVQEAFHPDCLTNLGLPAQALALPVQVSFRREYSTSLDLPLVRKLEKALVLKSKVDRPGYSANPGHPRLKRMAARLAHLAEAFHPGYLTNSNLPVVIQALKRVQSYPAFRRNY
jgi:hypothetical protein